MCQSRSNMKSGVSIIVDAIDVLSAMFLREVDVVVQRAKSENERARLAISGGSVADHFLPALCRLGDSAEHVDVFWCDERAVPLTDPQSNYRQAKELWFDPAGFSLARVFPMFHGASLEQCAIDYERLLRQRPSQPLDLVLLGLGPDGHIASLFPTSSTLESTRFVEPVYQSPKPPPERLTLTLDLLAQAPHIVIAAFGASKAAVLGEALTEGCDLPVARLINRAAKVTLFLDPAAAGKLPAPACG